MIRTLVHGGGRMAQGVIAQLLDNPDCVLTGVISRSNPFGPEDHGRSPCNWFTSLEDFKATADLVIDFTLPGGTGKAAEWCEQNNVALVSGTTGLSEADFAALKKAALKVPVLWAPNLSYGVALLTKLVHETADTLGVRAHIKISETHHKNKIDAPSGTALALAAAVMEGRSRPLEDLLNTEQAEGVATSEDGDLTFSSVREGEVIGEHTVGFELPGEVIELTHKAQDRGVFAAGALKAGIWLKNKAPGYYNTSDWLNL